MKAKVLSAIKRIAMISALILFYLFYNSLRFLYHYHYTLDGSNFENIIWVELIQPFIFAFILIRMIFLLVENKKKIFIVGGISFAFLLLYQPSVYTYEKNMLTFSEKNLALLNSYIEILDRIDIIHILNTDYYKREASAIVICCVIIYLLKDIKIQYSLSHKKILIFECIACILVSFYLLCLFGFTLTFEMAALYILIFVISFFISKGFTKLILSASGIDKTMLGMVLMVLPWLFNLFTDPRYNFNINESVIILKIAIIIAVFTFVCYTIELCNNKSKAEINP